MKYKVALAYEVGFTIEVNDVANQTTAEAIAMEIVNLEDIPEDADVVHRDYFVVSSKEVSATESIDRVEMVLA